MSRETIRACPICGGVESRNAFPYSVRFAGEVFSYNRCNACHSVFVNPIPSKAVFAKMYDKAAYHDVHYAEGSNLAQYIQSVDFMTRHVPAGSTVLDYGCGAGGFLKQCKAQGFGVIGVEFDPAAAQSVAQSLGCRAIRADEFNASDTANQADVVHFGDVLEHLPDPRTTLENALHCLRPGGYLYVEGPLEVNASPVYFAARAFGAFKRMISNGRVGSGVPTHLFRTHARAQREFFNRLGPDYQWVAWSMQETGWPYSGGGRLKRSIAAVSRAIGGLTIGRTTFGNRFRAVLRHRTATD